jgi:asparagine synthase (glutamine-hydrolysing)
VRREEAVAVAGAMPDLYDEPFADPSAIPTVLVSRLARRHVTVALTGDGGDELFAGYGRYRRLRSLQRLYGAPAPLRRLVGATMALLPHSGLRRYGGIARRRHAAEATEGLTSRLPDWAQGLVARDGADGPREAYLAAFAASRGGLVKRCMTADLRTWLPDDILVKLDRASMSVGLEGRVPLLDHRVVAAARALPI